MGPIDSYKFGSDDFYFDEAESYDFVDEASAVATKQKVSQERRHLAEDAKASARREKKIRAIAQKKMRERQRIISEKKKFKAQNILLKKRDRAVAAEKMRKAAYEKKRREYEKKVSRQRELEHQRKKEILRLKNEKRQKIQEFRARLRADELKRRQEKQKKINALNRKKAYLKKYPEFATRSKYRTDYRKAAAAMLTENQRLSNQARANYNSEEFQRLKIFRIEALKVIHEQEDCWYKWDQVYRKDGFITERQLTLQKRKNILATLKYLKHWSVTNLRKWSVYGPIGLGPNAEKVTQQKIAQYKEGFLHEDFVAGRITLEDKHNACAKLQTGLANHNARKQWRAMTRQLSGLRPSNNNSDSSDESISDGEVSEEDRDSDVEQSISSEEAEDEFEERIENKISEFKSGHENQLRNDLSRTNRRYDQLIEANHPGSEPSEYIPAELEEPDPDSEQEEYVPDFTRNIESIDRSFQDTNHGGFFVSEPQGVYEEEQFSFDFESGPFEDFGAGTVLAATHNDPENLDYLSNDPEEKSLALPEYSDDPDDQHTVDDKVSTTGPQNEKSDNTQEESKQSNNLDDQNAADDEASNTSPRTDKSDNTQDESKQSNDPDNQNAADDKASTTPPQNEKSDNTEDESKQSNNPNDQNTVDDNASTNPPQTEESDNAPDESEQSNNLGDQNFISDGADKGANFDNNQGDIAAEQKASVGENYSDDSIGVNSERVLPTEDGSESSLWGQIASETKRSLGEHPEDDSIGVSSEKVSPAEDVAESSLWGQIASETKRSLGEHSEEDSVGVNSEQVLPTKDAPESSPWGQIASESEQSIEEHEQGNKVDLPPTDKSKPNLEENDQDLSRTVSQEDAKSASTSTAEQTTNETRDRGEQAIEGVTHIVGALGANLRTEYGAVVQEQMRGVREVQEAHEELDLIGKTEKIYDKTEELGDLPQAEEKALPTPSHFTPNNGPYSQQNAPSEFQEDTESRDKPPLQEKPVPPPPTQVIDDDEKVNEATVEEERPEDEEEGFIDKLVDGAKELIKPAIDAYNDLTSVDLRNNGDDDEN